MFEPALFSSEQTVHVGVLHEDDAGVSALVEPADLVRQRHRRSLLCGVLEVTLQRAESAGT